MSVCVKCGKNLTYNEIGAYRKFVNRGGKDFLCKECLAKRLGISPERIDQMKMRRGRKNGAAAV